jgi:hypothetical protein
MNIEDNNNDVSQNCGIHFRSKTEAIEQLCLKVFGATPVYGTDIEDFKAETVESMYAKVVSVALDCDPIPAKDRADGKLEPPWEVFARVKRERDEWADKWAELSRSCVKDIAQLEEELNEWKTLNGWGGTPEIINDFIKGQQSRIYAAQEAEQQRDRLAEALRMITTFDYSDLQCDNGHGARSVAVEALQSLTPNEL